ncbi:MAG: (d)CMP kinase [Kiritimatiellia bacterium]
MKTIALVGVGLMGGSIGLALRARNVPLRIQVYARRKETRDAALSLGMADAVFADPADAVADADLVILCVPVRAIPTLLRRALPGLKHDAVVTDVGSTKAWLNLTCTEVLKDTGATFVGSHPMCGSEKTGLDVADANLYQGATCIVTADPSTRGVAWQVSHFWTRIGARVVEMSADRHDQLAAVTSHVPHLAASALVLVCGEPSPPMRALIGPGFRDSTRIASGSPALWRDIVETNPDAVCEGLRELQKQLSTVLRAVESKDFQAVERFLEQGVHHRNDLCKDTPLPPHANGVIAIDGPSASGKSTVARSIAKRMNSLYVDSGALYRGMTWMVLRAGAHPESEAEVLKEMQNAEWDFPIRQGAVTFTINGTDPGGAIRGEAVRESVSYVARIPEVRRFIVDQIRNMRALGPLVVEGRDIGSVVFPESPHKFYLDADPEERARRRNEELLATESGTSVEAVQESLRKRDHLDSTRKTAPLQIAEGARVVDTTELTLDEVVDRIIGMVRAG